MFVVKSLRTYQSPYNSLWFWWRLCVRLGPDSANCNYGIVLWDAIFFFCWPNRRLWGKWGNWVKTVPWCNSTQHRPSRTRNPGLFQAARRWRAGKNKEGERGGSFALTPTPTPRFFFCFHHFLPCQRSERLKQASGILTWQKDQVKYFWHRPHEKEFKGQG